MQPLQDHRVLGLWIHIYGNPSGTCRQDRSYATNFVSTMHSFTFLACITQTLVKRSSMSPLHEFSDECCRSPVTVGNWAIEKRFFYELGGLDTGMKLWGGENIDLPIRAVMAGGRHVNVPCAHAAHCAPDGSRNYRASHSPDANYRRVVGDAVRPAIQGNCLLLQPPLEGKHLTQRKQLA